VALLDASDVTTITTPATSLLIYNTTTAGVAPLAVSPGFYYWNGITWVPFVISDNSNKAPWLIGGNAGTTPANNFIGTTDNQPLLFKVRNTSAGYLDNNGNTFLGKNSGNTNGTGFSNVSIGNAALLNNTTRSNLVAVGDSALYNNGTGAITSLDAIGNTAIGSKALYANTIGSFNTALGAQALFFNTTAIYNTGIGAKALFANTTGTNNTAIGVQSLLGNTSGFNNVAIGVQSLLSNTTGFRNTATGNAALSIKIRSAIVILRMVFLHFIIILPAIAMLRQVTILYLTIPTGQTLWL
jgi:hypothetical protein